MRCRIRALIVLTTVVFTTTVSATPVLLRDEAEAPEDRRPDESTSFSWASPSEESRHAMLSRNSEEFSAGPERAVADDGRTGALVLGLFQGWRSPAPSQTSSSGILQRADQAVLVPDAAASSVSHSAFLDPSSRLFGEGLIGVLALERNNAAVAEARQWFSSAREFMSADRPPDPEGRPTGLGGGDVGSAYRERLIPNAVFDFLRENRPWLIGGILSLVIPALLVETMRPRRRKEPVRQERSERDRRSSPDGGGRSGEHRGERRSHSSRGGRRAAEAAVR